jgi:hypothetical protein
MTHIYDPGLFGAFPVFRKCFRTRIETPHFYFEKGVFWFLLQVKNFKNRKMINTTLNLIDTRAYTAHSSQEIK